MQTVYQPKGSMCSVCEHLFRDCSHLPFSTMEVMEKNKNLANCTIELVVKCTEFQRRPPPKPNMSSN